MNKKYKIIVAVTGASGAIYAKVLFEKLVQLQVQIEDVGVLMSDNAKYVWETELENTDYNNYPFTFYDKMDFMAPFASGSANFCTMIICPSSMGTMGRIAAGISNSEHLIDICEFAPPYSVINPEILWSNMKS